MKPRRQRWLLTAMVVAIATQQAIAHHAGVMFDNKQTLKLTGTVTQFEWINPHGWVHITVQGEDGKAKEWNLETASPNVLRRKGWTPTVLKPGDAVTITAHPMRDGSAAGNLVDITLPDGKVLNAQG